MEEFKGIGKSQMTKQQEARNHFEKGLQHLQNGELALCKDKLLHAACIQRRDGFSNDLLDTLGSLATAFEASDDKLAAMTALFELISTRDQLDVINHAERFKTAFNNPLLLNKVVSLSEVAEALAQCEETLGNRRMNEILLEFVCVRDSTVNQQSLTSYVGTLECLAFAALENAAFFLEDINWDSEEAAIFGRKMKSSLVVPGIINCEATRYQFIDQSVVNCLVARRLFDEIKTESCHIGKFNLYPLGSEAGVCSTIAELAQSDLADFHSRMLKIIYQSRTDASISIASGNAMTLLHRTRYCFAWKDFRRVNIVGANLAGADLTGTNLEESQLQKVNFAGCTLVMTNLQSSHLSKAKFGICFSRQEMASLCQSLGGRLLGWIADKREVQIWETDLPQTPRCLYRDTDGIREVRLSPDGVLIAAACWVNRILIWEAASGRYIRCIEGITILGFSPDHSYLASDVQDCSIIIWHIETGQSLYTLNGHSFPVQSFCYSADSALIASGSDDRSIILWQAATGQKYRVLNGHSRSVTAVCFSYNRELLVSSSRKDKSIRLWKVATGRPIQTLKVILQGLAPMYISRDCTFVTAKTICRTVMLCEITSGRQYSLLNDQSGNTAPSVSLSADDEPILAFNRNEALIIQKGPWTFKCSLRRASVLSATDDGTLMAAGSSGTLVDLLEPATGYVLHTLSPADGDTGRVTTVCFSRDNLHVAAGSLMGWVTVWETATAKECFMGQTHSDGVTALGFSLNGGLIASCDSRRTVVLQVTTGQQIRVLHHRYMIIAQVCFLDDNSLSVYGSQAGFCYHSWETDAGQQEQAWDSYSPSVITAHVSSDCKLIAISNCNKEVIVWSIMTSEVIHKLNNGWDVASILCFSCENSLLISCDNSGELVVWELATGQLIRRFRPIIGRVEAMCSIPHEGLLVISNSSSITSIQLSDCLPDEEYD